MELEQFYDEYIDKVYKFFYIKSLNKHVAEDLTSQTFVAFVENEQDKTDIGDNKKYLYGIMRNTWMQYLREKYRQAISGIEDIEDFEEYASTEVTSYESSSSTERIIQFINKLPRKQRIVVHKRLIEQKSNKQVAEELEKDVSYVKTTHHRGIVRLRQLIQQPYLHQESEAK